MRRRAMTLIEFLVVFSLFSLLATLAWDLWIGAGRQSKQIEEGSDLIRGALLLQENLTTDLERALSLRTLPPELVSRGKLLDPLVLPLYTGYRGDGEKAVVYRPVEYRWDPEKKQVTRNGRPVVRQGFSHVAFRWTEAAPTMLVVDLEGEKSLRKQGTQFTIQLPAPQGTDGLPIWVFAPHHQEAERAPTP